MLLLSFSRPLPQCYIVHCFLFILLWFNFFKLFILSLALYSFYGINVSCLQNKKIKRAKHKWLKLLSSAQIVTARTEKINILECVLYSSSTVSEDLYCRRVHFPFHWCDHPHGSSYFPPTPSHIPILLILSFNVQGYLG